MKELSAIIWFLNRIAVKISTHLSFSEGGKNSITIYPKNGKKGDYVYWSVVGGLVSSDDFKNNKISGKQRSLNTRGASPCCRRLITSQQNRSVADFEIVSWQTNDANREMPLKEFIAYCRRVVQIPDQH